MHCLVLVPRFYNYLVGMFSMSLGMIFCSDCNNEVLHIVDALRSTVLQTGSWMPNMIPVRFVASIVQLSTALHLDFRWLVLKFCTWYAGSVDMLFRCFSHVDRRRLCLIYSYRLVGLADRIPIS